MAMNTIPLAMPADLLAEVKRTADDAHLSKADVMRQAIKAGLPRVREALRAEPSLDSLKPLTRAEEKECWGKPDEEFDSLAAHCSHLPVRPPEE